MLHLYFLDCQSSFCPQNHPYRTKYWTYIVTGSCRCVLFFISQLYFTAFGSYGSHNIRLLTLGTRACAARVTNISNIIIIIINPRRACAERVTVVVLCVCMCMYVCMYVCVSTHTCRLTHWNHKREIPTDSA